MKMARMETTPEKASEALGAHKTAKLPGKHDSVGLWRKT